MDVTVVGSGYVGTTVAACLADLGHDVVAVDVDQGVVDRLDAGETHIHEPGLDPLVAAHAGGRLTATTDHAAVVDTDLTFLAVETRPEKMAQSTPRHCWGPLKTSATPNARRTATTRRRQVDRPPGRHRGRTRPSHRATWPHRIFGRTSYCRT
jgi:choline dehydrogenase-like flavoprotein